MALDDVFEVALDARTRLYLNRKNVFRQAFTNEKFVNTAGANIPIRYGTILRAIQISRPTIEDHDGAWEDADWEELTDDKLEFTVDTKKRFKFAVPTEVISGSPVQLIEEASTQASEAANEVVDDYIAAKYSQVDAGNAYGDSTTPIVIGFGTGEVLPSDALANLFEKLGVAKAPLRGANVVIPWWFATFLRQELGAKVVTLADITANGQQLANIDLQGLVAQNIGGFANIYASVAVPNTSSAKYKVMAGGPFISFAMALEQVKVVDIQNNFATGVKGLFVYGAKNLNPKCMALGTFNKGTAKVNA